MRRHFVRLIALALVPCLIADPLTASAFSTSSLTVHTQTQNFFQQQALSAAVVDIRTAPYERRITSLIWSWLDKNFGFPAFMPAGEAGMFGPMSMESTGSGGGQKKTPGTNLKTGGFKLKAATIPELLTLQVKRHGQDTFLRVPVKEGGYRTISFKEFGGNVEETARAFYLAGVRQQGRVAFISPPSPAFAEAAMAVWNLGGTVVSLSPRSSDEDLIYMASNSKCDFIVVPYGPLLDAARRIKDKIPGVTSPRIVVLGPFGENLRSGEVGLMGNVLPSTREPPLPKTVVAPEDTALILYTSGTSKLPKGVPLTHLNLMYNREASRRAWEKNFTDEDVTLGWLPFSHVMGLPYEFLGDLYVGAQYAFPRLKDAGKPTPEELLQSIDEAHATVFYTVPKMLDAFRNLAENDPRVLNTLKRLNFIMSGGAVLRDDVEAYFHQHGIRLIQGEGMTEVGGALFLGDPHRYNASQSFRLILPEDQVEFHAVEGIETGRELRIKSGSPTLTHGYLAHPEISDLGFGKTFQTGDLFDPSKHAAGFYRYIGRKEGDVLKLDNGEKVVALTLENKMKQSPLISEVAVVGEGQRELVVLVQPNYAVFKGKQWWEIEEVLWLAIDNNVNLDPALPKFYRVRRRNIIRLAPGETLPISPKGSLIRPAVIKNFADRIANVYDGTKAAYNSEVRRYEIVTRVLSVTEDLTLIDRLLPLSELTLALASELTHMDKVEVEGDSLTIAHLVAVAEKNAEVILSDDPEIRAGVEASVQVLADQIKNGAQVYGGNTGFGHSANVHSDSVGEVQVELIRHQNSGFGDSLAVKIVRGAMLIRANSNIKGYSGLRWQVLENLTKLLNAGITPVVPVRGSITASGDLMPLAFIMAVLMGHPSARAYYQGRLISAPEALAIAGVEPVVLGPKEGLAFINGTSMANSLAALILYDTNFAALLTQAITALSVEALLGTNQNFDPLIHEVKNHPEQIEVAHNILHLLEGSRLAQDELDGQNRTPEGRNVQAWYSLRTAPQFLAPHIAAVKNALFAVTAELNSVNDNPLIDGSKGRVLHTGNFQGTSIAEAMDEARKAQWGMGELLFAQHTKLINPHYNNGLRDNLAGSMNAFDMGLKGTDINMAGFTAELSFLAAPVTNHARSAEGHNQDVNSLGLLSARYTQSSLDVLQMILASRLYSVMQAIDMRNIEIGFQSVIDDAVKQAVVQTLPVAAENASTCSDIITKLLIKEARKLPPYESIFHPVRPYKPLIEALNTQIVQVFANGKATIVENGKEITVPVRLVDHVSAVADFPVVFDQTLLRELNARIPEAQETALQQGASHLLGNTRPFYEFIRSMLKVPFEQRDQFAGLHIQKIYDAIHDRSIVPVLLDALFAREDASPLAIAPGYWWGQLYQAALKGPEAIAAWQNDPANREHMETLQKQYPLAWKAIQDGNTQKLILDIEAQIAPRKETEVFLEPGRAQFIEFGQKLPTKNRYSTNIDVETELRNIFAPLFQIMREAHDIFFLRGHPEAVSKEDNPEKHRWLMRTIDHFEQNFAELLTGSIFIGSTPLYVLFNEALAAQDHEHAFNNLRTPPGEALAITPNTPPLSITLNPVEAKVYPVIVAASGRSNEEIRSALLSAGQEKYFSRLKLLLDYFHDHEAWTPGALRACIDSLEPKAPFRTTLEDLLKKEVPSTASLGTSTNQSLTPVSAKYASAPLLRKESPVSEKLDYLKSPALLHMKLRFLVVSDSGGVLKAMLTPLEVQDIRHALGDYVGHGYFKAIDEQQMEDILLRIHGRVQEHLFNRGKVTEGRSLDEKLYGLDPTARRIIHKIIENRYANFTVGDSMWKQFLALAWDRNKHQLRPDVVQAIRIFHNALSHLERYLNNRFLNEAIDEVAWIAKSMGAAEWAKVPNIKPEDRKKALEATRSAVEDIESTAAGRHEREKRRAEIADSKADERWAVVTKLRDYWLKGVLPTESWLQKHDAHLLRKAKAEFFHNMELAYRAAGLPFGVDDADKLQVSYDDHPEGKVLTAHQASKDALRESGYKLDAMLRVRIDRVLIGPILRYGEGNWIKAVKKLTGVDVSMPKLHAVSPASVARLIMNVKWQGGPKARPNPGRHKVRVSA